MKKELFRFAQGDDVYTLTSANEEELYNSETYTPTTLSRSEIEQKNDLARASLTISLPLTNEMARGWMKERLESLVTLTVFEKDENDDVSAIWKGRLTSARPGSASEIKLVFESIFTSLRRPGLRARWLRRCRHSLYGRGCSLDKDDFAEAATVTAVSGLTVTVPAAAGFSAGYFKLGMIEAPDGSLRMIADHSGSTLTLLQPNPGLALEVAENGDTDVILYPGCPRTRAICDSRFSNILNYGGFDWIPTRNPFDGSSIV